MLLLLLLLMGFFRETSYLAAAASVPLINVASSRLLHQMHQFRWINGAQEDCTGGHWYSVLYIAWDVLSAFLFFFFVYSGHSDIHCKLGLRYLIPVCQKSLRQETNIIMNYENAASVAGAVSVIGSCNNMCRSVYIDGKLRGKSETKSDTTGSPGYWQEGYAKVPLLIAVEGYNSLERAGIGVHVSTGDTTDETWKCTNTLETGWYYIDFDDSNWKPPEIISSSNNQGNELDSHTYARFPGDLNWIWDSNGHSNWQTAYCRGVIGTWPYSQTCKIPHLKICI